MSNYTKTTNFASKDNLSPGNPLKIVKGTEIDTEFNNIQTAVATKTDNSAANITGGSITGITDLAVADGGTGASTATAALNNLLPSQTSNANKYLQTDGTNATWDAVSLSTADITGTLPVANGGTGVTSSTGTGSVVLSNSPTLVTPALGTPASGTLTNATGLPISTGVSGLGTGVATFLGTPSSANLASAVTDETGSGALVFANSPTLVTPALGTPASGVLTNATGLPISTGVSGLGTGVATFLATPSSANLISAVTDETGTGSLVFATSPTLVTPALGTPSALVGTNITGTASGLTAGNVTTNANLTGAVTSVGNATSLGSFSSANLLSALTDETGTGSAVFAISPTLVTPILGTPTSATLTNATGLPIATGVSGLGTGVATFLATPSSANLAAALTDETGSGANVFATSPTLVTPILGTPTSATLTNATGLPLTTGVTGTLPTANGGTNLTSFTSGGVVYASSSSALATSSAVTFDGNTLSILTANNSPINLSSSSASSTLVQHTNSNASADLFYRFRQNGGGGNWWDLTMEGSTNGFTFDYNDGEILRLTSAGNVGIGTSSPTSKLQSQTSSSGSTPNMLSLVNNTGGAANATGVKLWMSGRAAQADADRGTYIEAVTTDTNNAHAMVFATSASGTAPTERMRISSAGNVSIGIGASGSSAISKLDIAVKNVSTLGAPASSGLSIDSNDNNIVVGNLSQIGLGLRNAFQPSYISYIVTSASAYSKGDLVFGTRSVTTDDAPSERLRITSAGDVGIGTSSPSQKLDVSGNINVSGTGTSSFTSTATSPVQINGASIPTLTIRNSTTPVETQIRSTTTEGLIRTATDHPLVFATNASERARIDTSGNLLVGTTSLNPSGAGTDGRVVISSANGGQSALTCYNAGTGAVNIVSLENGNGQVGRIQISGTSTSYLTSSDYRLKENIKSMTGALAKISQLKPVTYKWKVDGSDGQGFIAHELAQIVPECVGGEKDAVDANGNPQYQGIDTSFLVATLTAAIQELKAEFDAYKASHP